MNNCAPRLTSASFDNGLVELCWSDATGNSFHPIWLREHANPLLTGAYGGTLSRR
jgi:hypothetical protein